MDIKLTLDKKSEVPIYSQIANSIEKMVKQGELKVGEKLPPERELAASFGISRGTIKKAYEELEKRKVIKSVQGSGSFINGEVAPEPENRKDKAMKLIDDMLAGMGKLGFSYEEIKIYLELRLRQLDEEDVPVRVAALDCNPEALAIYSRQLSDIPNIDIRTFLLDDIKNGSNSLSILDEYELILTTTTHYQDIVDMFPTLKDKIINCAVSASRKTVVELARIEPGSNVGVFFESEKFANILRNHIKGIGVDCTFNYIHGSREIISEHTLENFNTIIVPPYYFINRPKHELDFIIAFRHRGDRIINFEYLIDRGSILYIENRIMEIKKR
jgi:DNA-binding transcriptional regulator YhcF (GntR family)